MIKGIVARRPWLVTSLLFLATTITTTAVGSLYSANSLAGHDSWILIFLSGWIFSAPLMSILLVHEMGHYLAGKHFNLDVTPPFFIPAIPPLGTFGAFIKIRSPIPDKNVLVAVGASGPLAGAVVAIPTLLFGLGLSEVRDHNALSGGLEFGTSIILELCCLAKFGDFSFNTQIILHPTALAAWFGLFVTAMNMLPVGQLDGGHVTYALFGPRVSGLISLTVLVCLIPLGILYWPGWCVFGILVLFLGIRHPPPIFPDAPLKGKYRILGWAAIILFLLTFMPVPISVTR